MTGAVPELDPDIVRAIYDAAVQTDRWPGTLDRLAPIAGAKGAAILCIDLLGGPCHKLGFMCSMYPPHMAEEYEREFVSYERAHTEAVLHSDIHRFVFDRDFTEQREAIAERPDVQFLVENFGVFDRCGARLGDDDSWFDCLAFQHAAERREVRSEEPVAVKGYLPHLAASMSQLRTFQRLQSLYGAVLTMLDRVGTGLLLVDSELRVVVANVTAERLLEAGDGLRRDARGRLAALDQNDAITLRTAVTEIAAASRGEQENASRFFGVTRPSRRDRYLIELSPLRDSRGEIENDFAGAMITLIDPDEPEVIRLHGMREIYGLTGAELAVAEHLVDGLSHTDMADERGVTPGTIHSQVRSIYRKTRSSNRTELVRRALRMNLPVER